MKRNIIKIDRDKCNGCGLCVKACAEGAIQLVDGKARLITDIYCDGLGVCLGHCPMDAIAIEEREAEAFDEGAVRRHLAKNPASVHPSLAKRLCPGQTSRQVESSASELRQWPIQLHLVPVDAEYWNGADLLLAADCVGVAYADFQSRLLRGRRVAIACPKLDRTEGYLEKLVTILQRNDIHSLTVARMEVPCCSGLVRLAREAVLRSEKKLPVQEMIIGIDGNCR